MAAGLLHVTNTLVGNVSLRLEYHDFCNPRVIVTCKRSDDVSH